jgi:hypothetical protein
MNPKESMEKLLLLINKFSRVTGHQKKQLCFYTPAMNNSKMNLTIVFTIISQRTKYLGKKPTKDINVFYTEKL